MISDYHNNYRHLADPEGVRRVFPVEWSGNILGLKNRKKIARKDFGKNETQNIAANGFVYDPVASEFG